MELKIFLFHRVSPNRDLLWDPLSPERFDAIISYIKSKYQLVQLEQHILNNAPDQKSKRLAAILFDDGYKDFIQYALPILKKHQAPTSMYIVTDCVANQIPPWTYVLDYHFINSKKLVLKLDKNILPIHLQQSSFKDNNSRINFAKEFKPFLKTIPNAQRLQLYQQVIASLNDVVVSPNLMMGWDDLKQIKNEGVEIGSHSVSHPLLAKIETEDEIKAELQNSGNLIFEKLGHFPITISYPIGSYNKNVKQIAINCGYKMGLAVNQISYNPSQQDLFEIPRIELYNESLLKTKLRISGIIQKIKTWRK